MPDQHECIHDQPPAPDDGDHLFRQTFLWRLRDPADREAMLHLARGFDSCLCELGVWGPDGDRMIPSMAAAMADDLEALAAYSLNIARVCEGGTMDTGDVGIYYFAPKWAERLAAMAAQMRDVVASARFNEK